MSQTTPFSEPLSQGLVTSRDPASLVEGELPVAAQAWYMPNDLAIYKAKGRTKFVTTSLSAAVKGLRYLEFDTSSNQIVAYSSAMYYRGDMGIAETSSGESPTYSSLVPVLSDVTSTAISATAGSFSLVLTSTATLLSVRPGYTVSSTGGANGIAAGTTITQIVGTNEVQLSLAVTAAVTANGTETVTFGATVGNGSTLEAIQYNNRHYLLNGMVNYVLESVTATATSGTTLNARSHGLIAITEPPITVATATGGHWNQSLGIGYWHFITTELIYPGTKDEVESTNTVVSSRIPSAQIVSADINTKRMNVTRPAITNAGATHWRVYGAVNKDAPTPPPLSSFQLMGQQDITATICIVGDVGVFGAKSAGTVATIGTWRNAASTTGVADNRWGYTETSGSGLTLTNFNFGTLSSAVVSGIEVVLRLGFMTSTSGGTIKSDSVSVDVQLVYPSSGSTIFVSQTVTVSDPVKPVYQTLTFGGNNYTWGKENTFWTDTQINSASFGATVKFNRVSDRMVGCYVDSMEIRIYTSTTSSTVISFGSYFPVIGISVGGVTSILGSHGVPPTATTGDVFDDQLVLNDVSDTSLIRYSLAGQPDYYPSLYFVNFETKYTDSVTNIGRVGNVLLVGLKNNIYRVNYLPRESDAEFDRGRCYEPLSEGLGIVGTQSATNVTLPGGNVVRAFVSYNGIHVTDGFSVQTWTDDIDWFATVSTPAYASSVDNIKNSILVDYPVNYQLWFFYTPLGGSTNNKALVFHYHPSHVKANTKPKITGPIDVYAAAACCGRISDMQVLLTSGPDTTGGRNVFIEDRGYVDNALTATANVSGFSVRTREMYMAGSPGRAVTVDTAFVQCRPDTTSTVSVTPRTRFGGEAQATITAKTFTTTNGGASEVPFSMNAESIDYTFAESGSTGQRIRLTSIISEVVSDGLGERRS